MMSTQLQFFAFIVCCIMISSISAAPGQSGEEPADPQLTLALQNPQGFMFKEHASSTAEGSSDLVILTARGANLKPAEVYIRPGSFRIFRADASIDEFTRQGGWYWRIGKTVHGKSTFKEHGALIMVVRDLDGGVQWYSLVLDLRC